MSEDKVEVSNMATRLRHRHYDRIGDTDRCVTSMNSLKDARRLRQHLDDLLAEGDHQ